MAGLRDTLLGMIKATRADMTKATRVRLVKGLTVAMKAGADETLAIQLSRADVYPSLQEWKTVMSSLPQHTVIELPRPLIAEHVYYLKGKIKLSQELMQ